MGRDLSSRLSSFHADVGLASDVSGLEGAYTGVCLVCLSSWCWLPWDTTGVRRRQGESRGLRFTGHSLLRARCGLGAGLRCLLNFEALGGCSDTSFDTLRPPKP